MMVRAKAPGYYERLRKPGDVFEIDSPKLFSDKWMEKEGGASAPPSPSDGDWVEGDRIRFTPEPTDELDALRKQYKEVVGKRPFPGWDADTLKAKMSEAAVSES